MCNPCNRKAPCVNGMIAGPRKKVCPVCGKPIVKHITKDGARYHVISYHKVGNSAIMRCSNPNCEINHRETCQYIEEDE